MKVFAVVLILAPVAASFQDSGADGQKPNPGDRGLPISANAPSFMPAHVSGSHAGRKACPVCIHGLVSQLQIWVEERHLSSALKLAERIDAAMSKESKRQPSDKSAPVAYLVISASKGGKLSAASSRLLLGSKLKKVFVTQIGSWDEENTARLYGHSLKDRPGMRVYLLANRRVFQRWDGASAADWVTLWGQMQTARKFVATHEVADAQIAPAWEVGQRLEISFQIVDIAGKPLSGVKVSAAQTDTTGLYNPRGWGRMEPRLSALAWTNREGRITFRTIVPGPYPTRAEPAHIHFTATIDGKPKWRTLWFEGDPLITAERRLWAERDQETEIVDVDKSKSPWRITHTFRHAEGLVWLEGR
jgi:protocatechuate 3,4-dioxygenase beta subunit